MNVTQIKTNEFKVEYKSQTWFVNFCEETDSCPGSTPEQYWDTDIEVEMTDKVRDLVLEDIML